MPPSKEELIELRATDARRRGKLTETYYTLNPITPEQIEGHKRAMEQQEIDALQRKIDEADTIGGSMDAAAALKKKEEKTSEPAETTGLLRLPTQQREASIAQPPTSQKKPSTIQRITNKITGVFKRAA